MRLSTSDPPHPPVERGPERSGGGPKTSASTPRTPIDHLSWRSFRDEPWFGAVPTLTAAAAATERLRLGTLVTSPNFRHPVTLAKELVSLDDISRGRLTVGIGAGGSGSTPTAMGQEAWSPKERADRFGEFLPLLDKLLTQDATTEEGRVLLGRRGAQHSRLRAEAASAVLRCRYRAARPGTGGGVRAGLGNLRRPARSGRRAGRTGAGRDRGAAREAGHGL